MSTENRSSTDFISCGEENNVTAVGEQNCPCPRLQDLVDNTPELAKSMGLSETCVQTASNTNSASVTSIAGFSLKLMGGIVGLQTTQEMNDTMSTSGCGDFFLNVKDIVTNSNSIACTLLNASVESTIDAMANARITLTTTPLTSVDEGVIDNIVDNLTDLAIATSNAKYTKVIERLIYSLCNTLDNISDRTINLDNVQLKNTVNQKIRQLTSLSTGQEQSLANDYNNISRASATQSLQNTLGVRALPPNTRSVLDDRLRDNFNNIVANINNIIQNNNVKVNADGSITLTAAGNINLKDTSISNTIEIDIVTQAIQKSAIGQGVDIAATIINEAVSDTQSENVSKGIEDLAKVLGDANADALEAGGIGGIGGLFALGPIIIAVCGLAAFFFFWKVSGTILPPTGKGTSAMIGWILGVIMIGLLIFCVWWFFFRSTETSVESDRNTPQSFLRNINNGDICGVFKN